MSQLDQRLAIPYIKLKFYLVFPKASILPRDKVSALRGGMGEMLLRHNCIRDRNCESCHFMNPCIVHKTMYTQMKKRPPFMQGKDSVGYLIECENYQTEFQAGEGFFFYLVLFGDNIVYFGQYLQAFFQLGASGIGKYSARYEIKDIRNISGNSILEENQVYMSEYVPETVHDYVIRRQKELGVHGGCKNKLTFHTPLCLKYQGEFIEQFYSEAIFQALFRRILMMDYFVEIYLDSPEQKEYPNIKSQKIYIRKVKRYSSTQDTKILMKGLTGTVWFEHIPEEYIPYLLAGELLHIGRNSSFGFGRYRLL